MSLSFDELLSSVRSCRRLTPDGLSLHPNPRPEYPITWKRPSLIAPSLEALLLGASIPLNKSPILEVGWVQGGGLSREILRRLPNSSLPLYVLEEDPLTCSFLSQKFQEAPLVPLNISFSSSNLPFFFSTVISLQPFQNLARFPKIFRRWLRQCIEFLAPGGTLLLALSEEMVSDFLKASGLGQFEIFPVRFPPNDQPGITLGRAQKGGSCRCTFFDGLIVTSQIGLPLESLEFQLRCSLSTPLDWGHPPILSSRLPLRPRQFFSEWMGKRN